MESFVGVLQSQNRLVIPRAVCEILKLKKGMKVRVSIEKVG